MTRLTTFSTTTFFTTTFSSLLLLCTACPGPDEPIPLAEGIYAAQGEVRPNATAEQQATFARGLAVAQRRFTPEMGLGPSFNVTFCGACHEQPTFGGSAGRYRNFLLVEQQLMDGSAVPLGLNGVQDQFSVEGGREPTDAAANHFGQRNPIPFFGIGLLAELPEDSILAYADPDDADGDGISGRPNIDRGFVGRFGRKAQTVSIEGFIRGPIGNHMGVTSNPLSQALKEALPVASPTFDRMGMAFGHGAIGGRTDAQSAAPDVAIRDDDGVPDPELAENDLFDLVSWAMLLAAPEPEELTEEGIRGQELFASANCAGCHVPALAGPRGLVPAYTDLLLHDMGEGLADGFEFGEASGSEFRTQPLWGVASTGPFLHDGRADTLEQAILAHGGEAQAARDAYDAMTPADQAAIEEFLLSLGGRDQDSSGLVPPNTPIPAAGGGSPVRVLMPAEETQFLAGREVFDRDMTQNAGLGPVFNGDSCRACHFEPVVGGAGPSGVDVIRHGRWEAEMFIAPPGNTIGHRHTLVDGRPPLLDGFNIIERRQTPSVLGLGLLDRIPGEMIMAAADPDDMDGDGIRGVAHVLADGRVGRLGWKAGVPSVAEFVRDAMSAEMGMTLPDQAGLTFGASTDDDGTADPEMSVEDLEALAFFIATLAPPTVVSEDAAAEAAGRATFDTIQCVSCHSTFTLTDGTAINVFSDLLLHDVAPTEFVGIPDGVATARQFRTAPLWGNRDTAPYMHDGSAITMEEAIAAHESESAPSRMMYEALDANARAELLMFLRSL